MTDADYTKNLVLLANTHAQAVSLLHSWEREREREGEREREQQGALASIWAQIKQATRLLNKRNLLYSFLSFVSEFRQFFINKMFDFANIYKGIKGINIFLWFCKFDHPTLLMYESEWHHCYCKWWKHISLEDVYQEFHLCLSFSGGC